MNNCCPHPESEHHTSTVCQDVIHYPSEDYPCLCARFRAGETAEKCGECGHPRGSHRVQRVCGACGCGRS